MQLKTAKWLFFITICSLASTGCGADKPLSTVTVQPCPRPAGPKMKRLDPGESVCSARNVTATAANASALRAYAEGLKATVECYEGQVR